MLNAVSVAPKFGKLITNPTKREEVADAINRANAGPVQPDQKVFVSGCPLEFEMDRMDAVASTPPGGGVSYIVLKELVREEKVKELAAQPPTQFPDGSGSVSTFAHPDQPTSLIYKLDLKG